MKPCLLYFNVFGTNPEHFRQLSLCLTSIELSCMGDVPFDIIVLCSPDNYEHIPPHRLPFKIVTVYTPYRTKMIHKYCIQNFIDISMYETICYSDIDIIFTPRMRELFSFNYSDTKIHAVCECDNDSVHTNPWFSLEIYTPEQLEWLKGRRAANAGFFILKHTVNNIRTMNNITNCYQTIMQHRPDAPYTDQSYMNHYCLLSDTLDTTVMTQYCKFVSDESIEICSDIIFYHFIGMGRQNKSDTMFKYLEHLYSFSTM